MHFCWDDSGVYTHDYACIKVWFMTDPQHLRTSFRGITVKFCVLVFILQASEMLQKGTSRNPVFMLPVKKRAAVLHFLLLHFSQCVQMRNRITQGRNAMVAKDRYRMFYKCLKSRHTVKTLAPLLCLGKEQQWMGDLKSWNADVYIKTGLEEQLSIEKILKV